LAPDGVWLALFVECGCARCFKRELPRSLIQIYFYICTETRYPNSRCIVETGLYQ
jgi:hypothetical protein